MYLNYRLPDIPVNPIPYPDFFLFTNMCILRRISNSEKAGKLISVRSIGSLPIGIRNAHASPSAVAANRIFSTAAHAEAK